MLADCELGGLVPFGILEGPDPNSRVWRRVDLHSPCDESTRTGLLLLRRRKFVGCLADLDPLDCRMNKLTRAALRRSIGRSWRRLRLGSAATRRVTWLILPVAICLSQRLSHACLSTSLTKVKPRMAH